MYSQALPRLKIFPALVKGFLASSRRLLSFGAARKNETKLLNAWKKLKAFMFSRAYLRSPAAYFLI